MKSFVISGLPGLWELKYRKLIASVIVFVLTFLSAGIRARFDTKYVICVFKTKLFMKILN